jgi:hypothetical protein
MIALLFDNNCVLCQTVAELDINIGMDCDIFFHIYIYTR